MESGRFYRLAAIDPSVDNMGFAIFEIDVSTKQIHLIHVETFDGEQLAQRYPHILLAYGLRATKLWAHQQNFIKQFEFWEVNGVVHEAPFMGRFPQAFGALMECVTIIRNAVLMYDVGCPLDSVDPISAKKAVGLSKKAEMKDKDAVAAAVQKLPDIICHNINFEYLSEHSTDAVAVGYWKAKLLQNFLGN